MASVEVEIAQRKYSVACRDGEEEHLRSVAAIVDRRRVWRHTRGRHARRGH